MPAIQAQVNGQISLGPPLFYSKALDAFTELDQQGMISAGHAPMVGLLLGPRVWHARHLATIKRFEAIKAIVKKLIPHTKEHRQ